MQEYAKGAGKGLKARGGFKGGAKCLTSLLEAHKKRRGRPASCREEEEGKAAVQGLQPRGRGSLPRLPPDAEARQGCDAGVRQRRWEGFEAARGV